MRHGRTQLVLCLLGATGLLSGAGCRKAPSDRYTGYVEGEFVYVASPMAGALKALHTQRGAQVRAGDPLFDLDTAPELSIRDEASLRLAQARATLEDLRKGKRPTEIAALEAQLRQARAALQLAETEDKRIEQLMKSDAAASIEFTRTRAAREESLHRVAQLEADLETARLGARADQIAATEASVRAQEATLAKAQWDLSQKSQSAPKSGLVFDTLYREGEWVNAGRPVVVMLPPENIKVRAFIPEARIGGVKAGDGVEVHVDGVTSPFIGRVSYVSPKAEYTPPVIFSNESRSKLVFMIEAVFDLETAARLKPGQPIDLKFTGSQ